MNCDLMSNVEPTVEELIVEPIVEELIVEPTVEELIVEPTVEELIVEPTVEELIVEPIVEDEIDKDNFELIKEIFTIINKNIETYYDLMEMRIDHHYLRQPIFKEKLYDMIPKLKKKYKSHKLTCLHNNSLDKQKFPTINMIRQILKCNKLKLTPQILCKGYNKINNQKIIERYYIIKKIV